MGDKRSGAQRGPYADRAVPEALLEGGSSPPLDRAEGVSRAREDVEPCRPGMDRRDSENALYWIRNASDYDSKTLEALEWVHGGGAPCARLRFQTAFLIAVECLSYDNETGELAVSEKGLDCLAFFGEERMTRA